jgi:hypothetical protein
MRASRAHASCASRWLIVATAGAVKPRCGDRKEEVEDMKDSYSQNKTARHRRAVSILPVHQSIKPGAQAFYCEVFK